MISANTKMSVLDISKSEQMRIKLKFIAEKCMELFEDFECAKSREQKAGLLYELVSFQKQFELLLAEVPDEDDHMREITGLKLSFERVEKEVIYLGGIQELKSLVEVNKMQSRQRSDNGRQEEELKKAVRKQEISDFAREAEKKEYGAYNASKKQFEQLSEDEKRHKIDALLEDIKVRSGFDLTTEKFGSERASRKTDLDKLKKLEEELKKVEGSIGKARNTQERQQLAENQRQLTKAKQMIVGLKSVYEAVFTRRNPVVKFFLKLFGNGQAGKQTQPGRASAVRATPPPIAEDEFIVVPHPGENEASQKEKAMEPNPLIFTLSQAPPPVPADIKPRVSIESPQLAQTKSSGPIFESQFF